MVIIHTGWGDLFEQFPAQNALYNSGEPGLGKEAANWLASQKIVARRHRHLGGRGDPQREPEGGVPGPRYPAHRQRHPHHGERAHRPDRRRGRVDQARDLLRQHDGAQGRRPDRQLRRHRRAFNDRLGPRHRVVVAGPAREGRHRGGGGARSPWRPGRRRPNVATPSPSPMRPKSPASASKAPGSPAPRSARASSSRRARCPIDLVFYDNHGDDARAIANAEAAIARKVDLYVQYHRGGTANAAIAQKLKAAGIPVLAVNEAVPGAPLYSLDNAMAGRIAGDALAQFAGRTWAGQPTVAVVIGRVSTNTERVRRRQADDALRKRLPNAPRVDARDPGQSGAGGAAARAAAGRATAEQGADRRDRRCHRAGGQVRGRGGRPRARRGHRRSWRRPQHSRRRQRSQGARPEQSRQHRARVGGVLSRSHGLPGAAARDAHAARRDDPRRAPPPRTS